MENHNKFKILRHLFLLVVVMFSILGTTFAGSVYLNLNNQIPDPVNPGNFVYLNIKVSNSGDRSIDDVKIRMVENKYFKIASGYDLEKDIGIIPAYSNFKSSNSFYIAKYKVYVDPSTPQGLNSIKFILMYNGESYEYTFDVLVEENNPLIEVENVSLNKDYLKPGEIGVLNIVLNNPNKEPLRKVEAGLDLDKVEGKVFSILDNTNEKIVPEISNNEKVSLSYGVIVSPDAEIKPYLVPIKIKYEDSLGKVHEKEVLTSIKINSESILGVSIDSQDIYTKGKGIITLSISNPGVSTIKGTILKIRDTDDYTILEGSEQYIGDLNPDDFQTLQSTIYIKNSKKAVLKVEVTYFDSYNNKVTKNYDLPLKIYSNEELIQLGLKSKGKSYKYYIIIIIILCVLLLLIIRRRKGKKRV